MRSKNILLAVFALALAGQFSYAQNTGSFYSLTSSTSSTLQGDLLIQQPVGEAGAEFGLTLDGTNVGYSTELTSGTDSSLTVTQELGGITGQWQWLSNSGLNMILDTSGNLTLASGTATIIFRPAGMSSLLGSLSVSGTDSEMPNQSLVGPGSILTQGLGDGRYLTPAAASSTFVTSSQASASYIPINPSIPTSGNVSITGTANAATFVGSGAKLTNLSFSQLSGTVSASQISGALPTTVNGASITGVLHGMGNENPTFGSLNLTGSMGIGTSSPAFKFQVTAGTTQSVATYVPTTASGISDFSVGGIGFQLTRPSDGNFANALYTYDSTNPVHHNLVVSARDDFVISTGNGMSAAPERMRVTTSGNVGIGTSAPFAALQIGPATTAGGNTPTFAVTKTATGDDSILFSRINYSSASEGLDSSDTFYVSTQSGLGGIDFRTQGSYFATGGLVGTSTSRLRILDNGNIGVNNSSPGVSLDVAGSFRASGTAAIGGNLTASGTANVMPNQTLAAGSSSILTVALADSRYLNAAIANTTYVISNQPGSVIIGGNASAMGATAEALGQQASASGNYSIAVGLNSSTTAIDAIAIGDSAEAKSADAIALGANSVAWDSYAVAIGKSSANGSISFAGGGGWVTGNYSVAIGADAGAIGIHANAMNSGQAEGNGSTALGWSFAEGDNSTAMGTYTVADSYGSTVMGQYNVVQGNEHSWIPTDDLFVIGNGIDNSHPSNALEVAKNGNMTVGGTAIIKGSLVVPGVMASGTSGPIVASGTNLALVPQQGDLSMGSFTAGALPQ